MFPLLAGFCSPPKVGKLLFWYLVACCYGRVGIRMGQTENVKLPVAARGSRTAVFMAALLDCFTHRPWEQVCNEDEDTHNSYSTGGGKRVGEREGDREGDRKADRVI